MVIALAAVLGGCGDDADDTARTAAPTPSGTPPGASPSTTPTPEATPAATVTGAPAPSPAPTQESGDEDGNRVELLFDVGGRRLEPARAEVPAFLGLRLTLRNDGDTAVAVILDSKPLVIAPPGSRETVPVEGLKPGSHTLETASGGRASIVAVRAGG